MSPAQTYGQIRNLCIPLQWNAIHFKDRELRSKECLRDNISTSQLFLNGWHIPSENGTNVLELGKHKN